LDVNPALSIQGLLGGWNGYQNAVPTIPPARAGWKATQAPIQPTAGRSGIPKNPDHATPGEIGKPILLTTQSPEQGTILAVIIIVKI